MGGTAAKGGTGGPGSPTVGVLAWATAAGEVRLTTSESTAGMVATDKPTPSADRPRNLRRVRRATLLVEGPCSWVCSWEFMSTSFQKIVYHRCKPVKRLGWIRCASDRREPGDYNLDHLISSLLS